MSNDLLKKDLEKIYSECFTDEDFGHLFFLGVLAYPGIKDKNHVMNFVFSVLSEKFKAMAEYFHRRYFIDKRLKGFESRKARRNIEHIFNIRMSRRMEAVLIALNIINKWEPNISKSIEQIRNKKYDLSGLTELYQEKPNIYKIVWSESKPVLHIAMAIFPLLKKIHHLSDKKPELLSIEMLDDLKSKGVRKIERQLKREIVLPLEDLFLLSNDVRKKLNIKEEINLLGNGRWLPEILKIAEFWYILLPKLIPTIKKEDLYKIF